jgi:hypothetical protein
MRYFRTDAPDECGTARFWVEDTFAAAAEDAGETGLDAIREGIVEFRAAIERGELRKLG